MSAPRLNIDFAATSRRPARGARALLALGAVALAAGALHAWDMSSEQRALADALAQLRRDSATLAAPQPLPRASDPRQAARERQLQDATRALHTPWADLFAALEAAPTQAVALLSIEPSVANRSLRLAAEAGDPAAMLGYLAALQKDVRLAQVVLVSHQVQAQSPGTPVRFVIQGLWADVK